jgi:hypothetical protein
VVSAVALEDWELTAARDAVVYQTLDELCTIKRQDDLDDDYGGVGTTTVVVAEDVPCRVHGEPIFEGSVPLFVVSLPYGTNVRAQDSLEFQDGTKLAVTRVFTPETWALFTQVEASTGSR